LPQPPVSGVETPCEALADHRMAYLDFEGPISGGRGLVARWDRGTCIIRQQSDTEWVVELSGEKLTGEALLRRATGDPNRWTFSLAKRQHE
jgi:hypothetical protein